MNEHLDSTVLANLQEVMESQYPDLLAAFLLDSRERLQGLHAALAVGDAEALHRVAHSFKGSCSNMGASRLAALCEQLECCARERQLVGTESLVNGLENEFAAVRIEFLEQIRRYDSQI